MDTSRKRRNHIIDSASFELSPAAELIANNIDLLTQILLCFPPKSLIRFKSVSKHWLSLISDSQFATNHSRRNPRPSVSGLFLRNGKTGNTKCVSFQGRENRLKLSFLKLPGIRCLDKIRYFGECDDLLILIQTDSTSPVECRILEMDKDYSRWIVKSRVDLGPLLSMESGLWRCCILKGDKEKDFQLMFAYIGKVMSYNLMSQTRNVLYDMVPGESINIYSWAFSAYKYVESLFPL